MDTIELTEEAANYLNTLSPEDRDMLYQQLKKERKPAETIESLTERLSELNPRQHRAEIKEIRVEIDKKMKWEAEKQLALFIDDELGKPGPVNSTAIKAKAKSLGIHGDVTPHIHLVMELNRVRQEGE